MTLAGAALAQQPSSAFLSSFASAEKAYQSGQFSEAGRELERLEQRAPSNADVHVLLGMTYAAEALTTQAAAQFRIAVRLSPRSVATHNNLATSLAKLNRLAEAEQQWQAALALDPLDETANRNLGRLYLQQGRFAEALLLLEKVQQARPASVDNLYDLAEAYASVGNFEQARLLAERLLREKDTADFHALLGRINEQQAKYVDAARQFSIAAHLDPSDENLFLWASELMTHRAYEAAIRVFQEGTRRYPASPRLWVGQGMALYARGDYEPAIDALLRATDLDANDARAYLFLSKAYLSSPSQAEAVIERFRRYAALNPQSARAQYDYAISLWKGRRVNTPEVDYPAVESLLRRSIALESNDAEVHLQLGNVLNEQRRYDQAQAEFEFAVRLQPSLADAHFRLGRAYLRSGLKEKAQKELDLFKTQQAQRQAALDKERAEVQQFVVATQSDASAASSLSLNP